MTTDYGTDYGKAAYLKAEDLERRLDAAASVPKIRNAYMSLKPRFRLNSADGFDVAKIRGEGAMALLVRLNALTDTAGTVELYVDGARAGAMFLDTGKNGEIFMNTVSVDGGGQLSLRAAGGYDGTVEAVEATLIGANADFDKTTFGFAADSQDGYSVVLSNDEGMLAMRSATGGGLPDLDAAGHAVAPAVRCDAVILDGVCYAVYTDPASNLWGCSCAAGQTFTERTHLGFGADAAAVTAYRDGLLIAVIENGTVKCFETDTAFSPRTTRTVVDTSVKAVSLLFIKNAPVPSLVYYGGGRSYLKTLENEVISSAGIIMTAVITVNQIA